MMEAAAMGEAMSATLCDRWPEVNKGSVTVTALGVCCLSEGGFGAQVRERCHEWLRDGGVQDNLANLFT
jgi:hypothetical protein